MTDALSGRMGAFWGHGNGNALIGPQTEPYCPISASGLAGLGDSHGRR